MKAIALTAALILAPIFAEPIALAAWNHLIEPAITKKIDTKCNHPGKPCAMAGIRSIDNN